MWCVQCWGKELFSYSETFFDNEQQAANFCENFNKHSGYAKIIQKEWIEKEHPIQEFPLKKLKKGLPIIVNSRYHRSTQTKKFSQMLGKYAELYCK